MSHFILIHPFTHSPFHSFTHLLIYLFFYYKVDDRKGAPLHLFTHLLIHPFTHSLIYSFTHLFIFLLQGGRPQGCAPTLIHPLTHLFIFLLQGGRPQGCAPTLIHPFTHSLIYLFLPPHLDPSPNAICSNRIIIHCFATDGGHIKFTAK